MSSNGQSDVVQIRLRYPDLDTFVDRYAANVSRGGLFLASRAPRSVGDVFRFELLLADGRPVLTGDGKVTWVKEFNPAEPNKPHGMGVQFLRIDAEAKPVLERILARKASRASGPSSSPAPSPALSTSASSPPPTVSARTRGSTGATPYPAAAAGARAAASTNGTTSADLATEYGIDDATLRRTLDRARMLAARYEELESLTVPEQAEPVTRERAIADLPRLITRGTDGSGGRRR